MTAPVVMMTLPGFLACPCSGMSLVSEFSGSCVLLRPLAAAWIIIDDALAS